MSSIFESITVLTKLPRFKKVGGVVIDGLLEESHIRKTSVTKYPVENGSVISDHILNEPESVTIVGCVTNTPLLYTTINAAIAGEDLFGDRE